MPTRVVCLGIYRKTNGRQYDKTESNNHVRLHPLCRPNGGNKLGDGETWTYSTPGYLTPCEVLKIVMFTINNWTSIGEQQEKDHNELVNKMTQKEISEIYELSIGKKVK